jgi:fructose-1,6-bisphosphatase/inositol monophosphatase family enzyme
MPICRVKFQYSLMALHSFLPASQSSLPEAIGEVLREAAKEIVLPRFRRLEAKDISEKAPGELVTVADREAETMIANGLSAILPTARILGEEVCESKPQLLRGLSAGDIWIIDPIDGTSNYAAGRAPFAMMAALLSAGEIVASAILNPLENRLFLAELGAGAWVDGERIGKAPQHRAETDGQHLLTGIVSAFQFPIDMEAGVVALSRGNVDILPTSRCAGFEYPLVATGKADFALYWRTLIWDHAPGALLIKEAGGQMAHLDGSPFQPGSSNGPLLLARNISDWRRVAAALQGENVRPRRASF